MSTRVSRRDPCCLRMFPPDAFLPPSHVQTVMSVAVCTIPDHSPRRDPVLPSMPCHLPYTPQPRYISSPSTAPAQTHTTGRSLRSRPTLTPSRPPRLLVRQRRFPQPRLLLPRLRARMARHRLGPVVGQRFPGRPRGVGEAARRGDGAGGG